MNDLFYLFVTSFLRAWKKGSIKIRLLAGLGIALAIVAAIFVILADYFGNYLAPRFIATASGLVAAIIGLGVASWERLREEEQSQAKIERVEERARENPDKPQLAWDLARAKLESYLDRNLGQLQSIFILTSLVMIAGFGLILYGLVEAYMAPQNVPVSVIGSASGVIVSFIGGSFLLIYRSVMAQTRSYVSVLERINAVGMAVQVLGTITDDAKELRNQSIANLARQLVDLYSSDSDQVRK